MEAEWNSEDGSRLGVRFVERREEVAGESEREGGELKKRSKGRVERARKMKAMRRVNRASIRWLLNPMSILLALMNQPFSNSIFF